MDLPTPRIRPSEVARITSLSMRQIQSMAASGKIPGAAKLGGVWTFDPSQISAWVRKAENEACRRPATTYTSAATYGGAVSSLPATSIDAAFERLIRKRPRTVSKAG